MKHKDGKPGTKTHKTHINTDTQRGTQKDTDTRGNVIFKELNGEYKKLNTE